MTRRFITFAACLGVGVVLAGCATPAVVPVAEPTTSVTPTATPTAAEAVDPTVVPANRFGLDCDSLVSAGAISALFDQALPLGPGNASLNSWRDAMFADTALVCRWGEGPYLDGYGASIDIIAGSSGSESLDALAAVDRQADLRPIRVVGIGDSAWSNCFDMSGDRFSCTWNVEVDSTWISISLNGIRASEVDVDPNRDPNGQLVVSSHPGSSSEQLVSEVASKIGTAEVQAIPAAPGVMPGCESLFDWEAISAEINVPLENVEASGEDPSNPLLSSAMIGEISSTALTRQSVRHCDASFRSTDQYSHAWITVSAVPGAQWLEASGLWLGWREQECYNYEGGPLCELSTITETAAVNISVSSHERDDIAALALAHFNG